MGAQAGTSQVCPRPKVVAVAAATSVYASGGKPPPDNLALRAFKKAVEGVITAAVVGDAKEDNYVVQLSCPSLCLSLLCEVELLQDRSFEMPNVNGFGEIPGAASCAAYLFVALNGGGREGKDR
jgi:hypothetical protein